MKVPKPLLMTKLMSIGLRMAPDRTPAEAGLAYEDVAFTSSDHLDIEGWFVPASAADGAEPGPVVLFVHGWMWNRMGNVAGRVPFKDADVDFLPAVKALHDAGFHVLLFDLVNHGVSGSRPPITYGQWEARDMLGAVAYLRTRDDVDGQRIGVIGTSMGGNTALWAAPYCQPIKAILAVQPTRAGDFTARFAADQLGKLGTAMVRPIDWMYAAMRAPRPSKADPAIPARLLTDTMVKYVQGTGDPWGTMQNVQDMVDASPRTLPLLKYSSTGRYEGYRYVNEQTEDVAAFFQEYV